MKKVIVLFTAMAALSAVATLAFVNNLCAIVGWWRAFVAAGGNSAAMEPVSGCMPWLDWSAVDHSAVTTFIPMLGFWCMTAALYGIMKRRRMRTGDYPFFRGSDQLNVALGLFGTLWGIIVIGYFDLATVTMGDLMQCLHTALFSTLTAVVWVFMIDRPLVRPLFTRLLEKSGLAETDEDDLGGAVERLVMRLGAASDEFEKRQKEFEEASARRHSAFEAEAEKRHRSYEEAFESRRKTYADEFAKNLKSYEEALENRHACYAARFDDLVRTCEESRAQRQQTYEKSLEKRLEEYETAFEKRLADYSLEFDRRQKEYSEFFSRRIENLEKQAAGEKAKAEASNAKLAAVMAALK